MKMNTIKFAALVACGALAVQAGADGERETFGKWRIAVGGAFNGGVSADLKARNMPVPAHAYVVPAALTEEAALKKALAREYDNDGYIYADDADSWRTQNWNFPASTPREADGTFLLDNAYQKVVGTDVSYTRDDTSDDCCEYGFSAELSRELYIYDEAAEHRWGVDIAVAFSYFFQREVYTESGSAIRTDEVQDGVYRTTVNDAAATYEYDSGRESYLVNGWGHGVEHAAFGHPSLLWQNVGTPDKVPGDTTKHYAALGYSTWGDYQELEMLFLVRPWYEITDWWRVFANVGLGVSWGRFESEFHGAGVYAEENFDQWDVYGVAGLGTIVRYKQFDISLDVFGRFLRDDMDIYGRYVKGSIERSNWGLRLMAGFEF